jgi:hypothetical protein
MHTEFRSENLKERDHSGDLRVDGRNSTERHLKETGYENVDLVHVFQDGVKWLVLEITEINIRDPKMIANFLTG